MNQISEGTSDERYFESTMTPRDWFAALALMGILSDTARQQALATIAEKRGVKKATNVAEICYELADAMMEERKKAAEPNVSYVSRNDAVDTALEAKKKADL